MRKQSNERRFVNFDPALYASVKDSMPVKVFFDENEIAKRKAQHFEDCVKLDFVEQEKKEMLSQKNAEIKKLKTEIAKEMAEVKKGYREEVKEVYLVPNFDEGKMEYITADREIVQSRKLRPDEMQDNVISLAAAN